MSTSELSLLKQFYNEFYKEEKGGLFYKFDNCATIMNILEILYSFWNNDFKTYTLKKFNTINEFNNRIKSHITNEHFRKYIELWDTYYLKIIEDIHSASTSSGYHSYFDSESDTDSENIKLYSDTDSDFNDF